MTAPNVTLTGPLRLALYGAPDGITALTLEVDGDVRAEIGAEVRLVVTGIERRTVEGRQS